MEKRIDLHTHSNKSDGSMTPSELVRHAKESGLSAIALTDHDGVDGLEEALDEGRRIGIEVVPAIELAAKSETETHILGYFIDFHNAEFLNTLKELREMRRKRNTETAKLLQENGFDITTEDAAKFSGGSTLGRAHFAKAMVEKGYIKTTQEAFDLYLANGRPCYYSVQLLSDKECIKLINSAGGLAFCAHLHLMRKTDEELYDFLSEMKKAGLCGIEGYYTDYTPELEKKYKCMAGELGLEISGGTDFHGTIKPHISIGTGRGNLNIGYDVLERIKGVLGK